MNAPLVCISYIIFKKKEVKTSKLPPLRCRHKRGEHIEHGLGMIQ